MKSEIDIQVRHCPNVYPPSEDSYLTCLGATRLELISRKLKVDKVDIIDVGSGTGITTICVAETLRKHGIKFRILSIDILFEAAKCTLLNVTLHELVNNVDIVVCDALSCIKENYRPIVLISNPPYLPEDTTDICNPAYCGGPDGRSVIDKIIHYAISKRLILILTQSSLSNITRSFNMLKDANCDIIVLGLYHIFFEDIITFMSICY